MRARNPFVQALLLIVLAFVVAVVANAFASRTRRLMLPGFYPNALRVPPRVAERVMPAPVAPAPVTQTVTDVGRASARPAETTTTAPPVVTATATITPTTTTMAPAPPERRAEARPTLDLGKYQPHPDKAYVEIGGDEAAGLHAQGVLFLDARRSAAYEEGHIAGARPFSVWESDVDEKVNKLYEERQDPSDQNKPIVIYCTGGACEDSHMLAQKLWGIQFNNVYVYKDGFPDWQKRGGPQKTGAQP
jgi:rhodanese-related sulfurtransferase